MTTTYIILGIIFLLGLILVVLYNSMVTARNRTEEAWSDIDVQLKRRYDLIPNLLETVKGYAGHEKTMLSSTLKSLFAVSENYPDLKANTNFLELQRELSDTENKIQASRRFYNSTVLEYNTKLQTVPTNIFARMFIFTPKEFFELEEAAQRENVSVKF
jgi:LemA protein